MSKRLWFSATLALAIAFSAGLVTVQSAQACGGFFCQNSPIDQNAERIIFTQNHDGTVSAYIQIHTRGRPLISPGFCRCLKPLAPKT